MDSRKSNGEEVLKRDYGVIRLGIGEQKIDSDEESFGSNSDSDDYPAEEQKKGGEPESDTAKNAEAESPTVEK